MSPAKQSSLIGNKLKTIIKDSWVNDRVNQFELKTKSVENQTHIKSVKQCRVDCSINRRNFAKMKMEKCMDSDDRVDRDAMISGAITMANVIDTDKFDDVDESTMSLYAPPARPQAVRFILTPHERIQSAANGLLPLLKRFLFAPFYLPFVASINGFGLTTLASVLFAPRLMTQIMIYPTFRLVFGTLYPAYASYKAVRSKDVKDYVSVHLDGNCAIFSCDHLFHSSYSDWFSYNLFS